MYVNIFYFPDIYDSIVFISYKKYSLLNSTFYSIILNMLQNHPNDQFLENYTLKTETICV